MLEKILPLAAFVLSLLLVAFAAGVYVAEFKVPPYRSLYYGAKTVLWQWRNFNAPPTVGTFIGPVPGLDAAAAADNRLQMTEEGAALPEAFLITGGLNQYLEHCPERGCLALEMTRDGEVRQAIPFRPDEIFAADETGDEFYREGVPADAQEVFRPVGLAQAGNGDLFVSFLATGPMFPYAAGLARVDRDGHPVWFRFDYSHHWVTHANGRLYVPDLTVADGNLDVPVGPQGRILSSYCESGRPMIDGVLILDPNGVPIKRIDLMDALKASPHTGLMVDSFDACDPLHANFVDVLDETAPGGDLAPGNLVISLRNLSAVVVLDPDSGEITRVVRGTFQHQHSVQQLEGSRVLMFDNWGGSGPGRGSRLLEVDLAGGERQVFPPPDAPDPGLFSFREGHLDISPDRERAIVTFTDSGSVEVDLETGAQLMRYDSLHTLASVEEADPDWRDVAVRAKKFGIYYLDR